MVTERSSPIRWLQVWGLASVQGAITLMWVIYNLYLSTLLTQAGLPASLSTGLLIVENLLAAVVEPLVGSSSDRLQRTIGSRFPFIAAGAIGGSALFIALPLLIIWGNQAQPLHWIFLLATVAWALAMTVIRSPALSLLGRYAFGSGLPQAASILTLVGAVTGAVAPFGHQFILNLGSLVAFAIGSLVLLGAAAVLRWVDPPGSVPQGLSKENLPPPQLSVVRLALVIATGVGVAIGFRLMLQVFPQILAAQVPQAKVSLILGGIFVGIAATAIPAGAVARRMGNAKAMLLGCGAMALEFLCLLRVQMTWQAVLLALGMGATFSLISNGTLPFALSMVPPSKAGLGTGLFFSGGAIGLSLFFSAFSKLPPAWGTVAGAGAFLWAGGCLLAAYSKNRLLAD